MIDNSMQKHSQIIEEKMQVQTKSIQEGFKGVMDMFMSMNSPNKTNTSKETDTK